MGKIFITSDWHFCHDRLFLYGPRHCETVGIMNDKILIFHNKLVSDEDDVYVLGDCMLCDNEKGLSYIKRMNGKLHIICGNHDTENRKNLYLTCPNVVEVVDAAYLSYKKYHFFLSHYPAMCGNYDDGKSLTTKTINLCGHTHTRDKFYNWEQGLIYHCEVDAHELKPVLIDDIIEELKEKINEGKEAN